MNSFESFKQTVDKINTKIWSTIEMTPQIWEILWTLYNEEHVFVKSIEVLTDNRFKIRFVFPEYNLTKEKLWHVSWVQMQLAIFQWLYLSIGLYIKNNPYSPITFEDFLKNRNWALYRRDTRTFSKMLQPWENWYLIFEINSVKTKWWFHSVTTKLLKSKETFINWEVECVLEKA